FPYTTLFRSQPHHGKIPRSDSGDLGRAPCPFRRDKAHGRQHQITPGRQRITGHRLIASTAVGFGFTLSGPSGIVQGRGVLLRGHGVLPFLCSLLVCDSLPVTDGAENEGTFPLVYV